MDRVAVASAPGRLCLAGESLDWMMGGRSLVAAVPLRTTVAVTLSACPEPLLLRSSAPLNWSRVVHTPWLGAYAGDELDLLQAAARIALRGRVASGIVDVDTELPVGAGLSSSAALALAASAALLAAGTGVVPDADQVCGVAYSAEHGEMRTGAGWMDFMACAHGGVAEITGSTPPVVQPIAPTLGYRSC